MLIGVVGLHAAGKDSIGRYLVEHYNFEHKDLGQEIRDELKKLGKNSLDRNEMVALANERRERFGFDYWCKRAIESARSKDLVITSLRNPSEVEYIKSLGGVIVEVFADQKVRFRRIVERVRNNPDAHGEAESFEDFKAKEERELENPDPAKQQLLKCISMAEFRIDNNGSVEKLDKGIEDLFARLKSKN